MLVLVKVVSVGVFGAPGTLAGIISSWAEGSPKPTAFWALTLNRYLTPVDSPELR